MLCPYNSLFFTLLIYFIIFSVWIFVIAECSEDLLLTEIPESSIRKDKLSLLPKRVGNKPSPCTSMLTANRKTNATAPQRAEIIKIDLTYRHNHGSMMRRVVHVKPWSNLETLKIFSLT